MIASTSDNSEPSRINFRMLRTDWLEKKPDSPGVRSTFSRSCTGECIATPDLFRLHPWLGRPLQIQSDSRGRSGLWAEAIDRHGSTSPRLCEAKRVARPGGPLHREGQRARVEADPQTSRSNMCDACGAGVDVEHWRGAARRTSGINR